MNLSHDPLPSATLSSNSLESSTMQLATQGESMQPPLLAKEECDSWWATEDDKNAWMEFQQVNEVCSQDR